MSVPVDAARFAVGTYTRLPVQPPARLDRSVAAWGVALGPLVGAGLGVVGGLPLLVPLAREAEPSARALLALLAVGLTAWLTRGLHWDGLADLADGLGSGAGQNRARAIMKRSDIGPFGVLTLAVVLGTQVLAMASLPPGPPTLVAWAATLSLGRLGIAIACGPWAKPATETGLGALVVGALRAGHLMAAGALAGALALVAVLVAGRELAGSDPPGALPAVAVLAAPLVVAGVVTRIAAQRLGGSTGDVLGACAELSTAAALVVLVLMAGR